jgi:hypothetical protein
MISSPRQLLPASVVLVALALGVSGCNNSNNSNSTGPTPTLVTETYSGSLVQGGTFTHQPFTVTSSGNQLLAGFTAIGPATVTALGIGIGAWDPTASTCGLNQTQVVAAPVGSTAISATGVPAGAYCVRVFDGGNVGTGTTATYTVQVQHY